MITDDDNDSQIFPHFSRTQKVWEMVFDHGKSWKLEM